MENAPNLFAGMSAPRGFLVFEDSLTLLNLGGVLLRWEVQSAEGTSLTRVFQVG
ncbi:UNVERIFIED_CONTAM: hypothetical protein Sradi_1458500 [Sesamum radiatum]|uniref:Uncharacterized protein n=1 Tax=Sesamum radiatum TaxID=300843 RepID=A0AAW2U6X6_SESRA